MCKLLSDYFISINVTVFYWLPPSHKICELLASTVLRGGQAFGDGTRTAIEAKPQRHHDND
jgi:hypothetical protein